MAYMRPTSFPFVLLLLIFKVQLRALILYDIFLTVFSLDDACALISHSTIAPSVPVLKTIAVNLSPHYIASEVGKGALLK